MPEFALRYDIRSFYFVFSVGVDVTWRPSTSVGMCMTAFLLRLKLHIHIPLDGWTLEDRVAGFRDQLRTSVLKPPTRVSRYCCCCHLDVFF